MSEDTYEVHSKVRFVSLIDWVERSVPQSPTQFCRGFKQADGSRQAAGVMTQCSRLRACPEGREGGGRRIRAGQKTEGEKDSHFRHMSVESSYFSPVRYVFTFLQDKTPTPMHEQYNRRHPQQYYDVVKVCSDACLRFGSRVVGMEFGLLCEDNAAYLLL